MDRKTNKVVGARVTDPERLLIEAAAAERGVSVSAFVRAAATAAARTAVAPGSPE